MIKLFWQALKELPAFIEERIIDFVDDLAAEQRRRDRIREAGGCPECGQYIGDGEHP